MHTLIRDIADDDRAYDPWGAGMAALFAICDVLATEGEDIPTEAAYSPGAMGPHVDADDDRARTLMAGLFPDRFPGFWVDGHRPNLTVSDLQYAARVLCRYLDLVRIAGRDY